MQILVRYSKLSQIKLNIFKHIFTVLQMSATGDEVVSISKSGETGCSSVNMTVDSGLGESKRLTKTSSER